MRKTTKRLGVATLAAATIVSGLSFGPAAAQAVDAQADTMTRPFIMKSLTEKDPAKAYVGAESREADSTLRVLRANTGMTTYNDALRASMNATFPTPGNSGKIVFENGTCLTLASYNGGYYMGSTNCATAENFTVHTDGKLESRNPAADLKWAGVHSRNNGVNTISRTATPVAALELALAPSVLTGTVSPTVTVAPGQSTTVSADFLANRDFGRPTAGTTVTFTAPAGTTFTADQTTIRGQYRPAGGTWRNFAEDNLTGGSLSADKRTATFEWSPTNAGWSQSKGNEIRFPISIDVPAGASNSDATLSTTAIGSTAKDSFKTAASTGVQVRQASNGGFDQNGVGTPATVGQGEQVEVQVGVRTVEAPTPRGEMTLSAFAPAGTTFPSDLRTVHAEWKFSGGDWTDAPLIDMTGSVSPDGKTFTGKIASDWDKPWSGNSEGRWTLKLNAAKSAAVGERNLSFAFTGTTNYGRVATTGNSPITVVARHDNGGFEGTGVGTPASVRQGERVDVNVGARASGEVSALSGATVRLTAPTGATFPSDMTSIDGSYKHVGGGWTSSTSLRATGTVSANGRTFTGKLPNSSTLRLHDGSETRWTPTLDAAKDAATGTRNLAFTFAGSTDLGAFTTTGSSAVTVEASAVRDLEVTSPKSGDLVYAPEGTPGYPNARVEFTGSGEPGATIEGFRSNGKSGGATTVNPDGTWTMNMDMAFTTYPVTTVAQTVGDAEPTKREITNLTIARDGAQKQFTVNDLANGKTIAAAAGDSPQFPNAKLTVTGEGVAGSEIVVRRHNEAVAGKTKVLPNGTWTVDANLNWGAWDIHVEHVLPNGSTERKSFTKVNVIRDSVDLPFKVISPESNGSVEGPAGGGGAFPNAKVTFTGEGKAGDRLQVIRAHNGKTAGTGTVKPDGTWSVDCDFNWGTWSADVLVNGEKQTTVTDFTVTK